MAELLFWPALIAYGEAAVAYVGVLRRPELAARLAIWGVRIGWLAQTALLAVQAWQADGFPWADWAGALNLFVWFAVGAYLVYGSSPRYRLLGIAVMPGAAILFALAGLGGAAEQSGSDLFTAVHVGLVVAGFAGFALAAALAGLYLWLERRLKRRPAGVLRLGPPSLVTLDGVVARVSAVSLAAFTVGHRARARARTRRRSCCRRRDRSVARLRLRTRASSRARLARSPRGVPDPRGLRARRVPRTAGGASRMRVTLVGVSHHGAGVELRERVALRLDDARAVAEDLAQGAGEAVCLSTCNRTELYIAHEEDVDAEARATRVLLEREPELANALYRLRDEAAALHLFRVAAGLDSLVPGEGEILGQVRSAFDVGSTGALLDRLFRQALYAGRKARAQTGIGESPASVPAAAAALAQQVFGDLKGRRILLVGAGRVSEQTARSLVSRGAEIAVVANRTLERATELAERFGSAALPLERVEEELERADVVVASTSSPEPVLRRAHVERALRARRGHPLFLIDLAVPRDLDPAINELDGCYLYDIDDLEAVVAESLGSRRREAAAAEAIVAAEAEEFRTWQASLEVVPAIASLRARAEEIRRSELAKAESRLGELSDAERRAVESVTAQIVNKLLHLPTVRMKQAAAAADGVVYADAVRHLFGLEDER